MRKQKILVVSDTHKMHVNFDLVLEKEKPVDFLFHAGDVEGRDWEVQYGCGCPAYVVAGNNDFFAELPPEVEIKIGAHKIFMTHGHHYFVSMTLDHLKREARAREADVVIFGHTHRPVLKYEKDMIIMNPGSLTYPRQENRLASYIVLEIDENDKITGEIKYIEKN